MRIVDSGGTAVSAVLTGAELQPLAGRIDEIRDWVGERGLALPIARYGDGASIVFPVRPIALLFIGTFVPGGLADIARPIAESVADFAEVSERGGAVDVTIRYVGDAGSGTGREPQDQTADDYASFSQLAREAGFEAEFLSSDHDTIEAVLRPGQ